MKKRIKSEKCLNCDFVFKNDENYCPQCGQENNLKIKSLGRFLKSFVEETTSLNTRFLRTVPAFLFKPGKLTTAYIQGKYNYYVAPVRLYLVLSFIYFLIFSWLIISKQPTSWYSDGKKANQAPAPVADTTSNHQKTKPEIKNEYQDEKALFMNIDLNKLYKLAQLEDITEEMILDSLQVEKTFLKRVFIRQVLKINKASPRDISKAILANLPLMMFFLLPVFALLLKLLYIRRKKLLVEHLIFMMHFHAFYFFIFSILTIFLYFSVLADSTLLFSSFGILLLYSYKSFRNVYHQNRFKTILKLFFFVMTYPVILALGLLAAAVVSLIFF